MQSRPVPSTTTQATDLGGMPFRLRVDDVDPRFADRCSGSVLSGQVRVGDEVRGHPFSDHPVRVLDILSREGSVQAVGVGERVTLTLSGPQVLRPGDLIADSSVPARTADQFEAVILWSDPEALFAGRKYRLAVGPIQVAATVTEISHRIGPDGSRSAPVRRLDAGETGLAHLLTERAIPFDRYDENPATGRLEIVDPATNRVVGSCELRGVLASASDLHLQTLDVTKEGRAALMRQKACVIWFTGLSGAGKSTIANLVEKKLYRLGHHTYLLDGDNVRHGLNKDLGFSEADRVENIRRIAEVARLMVDAGLITLVSFISPFRSERLMARGLVGSDEFFEVFIDTPLAVAEARDPKGLYRKARRGELKNFTGLDSPYEMPESPELRIQTTQVSGLEAAEAILDYMRARGVLRLDIPPSTNQDVLRERD